MSDGVSDEERAKIEGMMACKVVIAMFEAMDSEFGSDVVFSMMGEYFGGSYGEESEEKFLAVLSTFCNRARESYLRQVAARAEMAKN